MSYVYSENKYVYSEYPPDEIKFTPGTSVGIVLAAGVCIAIVVILAYWILDMQRQQEDMQRLRSAYTGKSDGGDRV
jgi:preprotein translocase subunit Sec61beta